MNIGFHQVSNCVVNQSVTLNSRQVGEFVGHDVDCKVTFAVASAFVTNMLVAFVDNVELIGVKRCGDAFANLVDSFLVHGNTSLNGLTVTDS